MNIERLTALNFHVCAGQIDRDGVNYGVLLRGGEVLLTPEGEDLVLSLDNPEAPAPDARPARAPARKAAKAREPAQAPVSPDEPVSGLVDD